MYENRLRALFGGSLHPSDGASSAANYPGNSIVRERILLPGSSTQLGAAPAHL